MVLGGHCMGAWPTALVASHDRGLRGAILIRGVILPNRAKTRAAAINHFRDDMESLAHITPEQGSR